MNRTLRRPMFRMGGTAEGITSGLDTPKRGLVDGPGGYAGKTLEQMGVPKTFITAHSHLPDRDIQRAWQTKQRELDEYFANEKNIDTTNKANTSDFSGMKVSDLGNMSLGQLQELSKAMAYKPRGTNVYDFMTEFGLDLLSRPKSGNIFQQVATSAKGPYEKYMERKQSAAEQKYGSESDMFKTMMGGAFDVMAAKEEAGESAKTFDKENTAKMIGEWIRNIDKNKKLLENTDLSQDKRDEIELQIQIDKTNLKNLKKKNIYAEAILKSDKFVKGFVSTIIERLKKEKKPDGSLKYPDPDNNDKLMKDAYDEFVRYFEEEYATGGRVGYQMGGDVMPGQPMQAAMPTDQESEAPEEIQNIDFNTLRARLPSSITDDIVRLIANSPEAMEDFATIQTQQDINSFNEKYGVELVLPTEA